MIRNLIIRTSHSMLPNGDLKPDLGDLIRCSIILNCIKGNFLWITDSNSIDLLKYFIEPKKIISVEKANKLKEISADNIYNLDNYVAHKDLFNKIKGKWHGFLWNGKNLSPENKLIKLIAPPYISKKSWQQVLVEGLGFKWEQQDYPLNMNNKGSIDIGFNWHVHPDWKSKQWALKNWKKLEKILQKNYSISWQEGMYNFDEYINWLSSCKLIITGETLGLHLASALRKKVIVIAGPTDSNEFHYDRILKIKPNSKKCMPCFSPKCRFKETCLNEITPEEISKIISKNIYYFKNNNL